MATSEYLSPEQLRKLFACMEFDNALAMECSLETGLRIGDVLSLREENLTGRKLSYTASKTGKKGSCVLSASLSRLLAANAGGGWLFPGRSHAGHRSRQAVYIDMRKTAVSLGMKGNISPHSARKSFAVSKYKTDGLGATQKALQHSDLSTTLLYCLSDSETVGCQLNNSDFCEQFATLVAEKVAELIKKEGD